MPTPCFSVFSAPETGLSLLTFPPVLQAHICSRAPLIKFSFQLLYLSIPDFFVCFYLYVSVDILYLARHVLLYFIIIG